MPRKPIVRSSEHYYHVVARSNNRESFYLPIGEVWSIMTLKLHELQRKYNLKIGAFVLMNNHFHLLVLTPEEDIDRMMYFFMKDVTRFIQRRSGRINKIFGGRYKGCLIEDHSYLLNVYKYISRNPVAAGLSKSAQEYPYSSLFYQTHPGNTSPFQTDEIVATNALTLEWINASYKDDVAKSIQAGLRKSVFSYLKKRATGKSIKTSEVDVVLT